jgi:exodeoxyribonuclease VII large subunit
LNASKGFGGGIGAALTVGMLTRHLSALIHHDEILQDVWVRGEVMRCTRAASGHVYFSLKDDQAVVDCVVWRTQAARIAVRLEPGLQAVVHGSMEIYPPRGQYQLVVDDIRADGQGVRYLELERVRARLDADGLFQDSRKRPIPKFPRQVAVITSLHGAAVRDICVTLLRATPPPELVLVPALVQGSGAAASLCRALELVGRALSPSVVIIGRGGGGIEDLWCFNEEPVVRAVGACPVPIISAVGHESDFSLSDLAADARASTPTAAAELLAGLRDESLDRWQSAGERAIAAVALQLDRARRRMDAATLRGPLARPEQLVSPRQQQLDFLNQRLDRARELSVYRWQQRLALAAGKLDGLSPLATLARGYAAVVRMPAQIPVTSIREVAPGDELRIRVSDGAVAARVIDVEGERRGEGGSER